MMTVTTIGYGDVGPKSLAEQVYCIIAMLIGAGFFSFVVGTCVSLVDGLDATNMEFQAQLDSVNDYMEESKMPRHLRKRIRDYLWNYKIAHGQKNKEDVLRPLSPALKQEVLMFNFGDELRTVPHFKGAPTRFLCEVAVHIVPKMFGPGDVIVQEGDSIDLPFFVLRKGEVHLIRTWIEGSAMVGRRKNRGFWNERALAFGGPADTTVVAVGFVETHTVDCATFLRPYLKRFALGAQACKLLLLRRRWLTAVESGYFYLAMRASAGKMPTPAQETAVALFMEKSKKRRRRRHRKPIFDAVTWGREADAGHQGHREDFSEAEHTIF